MCGIIGSNRPDRILEGLKVIKGRGRDGYGILDNGGVYHSKNLKRLRKPKGEFVLGHALHSVVGAVKQPFYDKTSFVSNCEIYNWKPLCQKYNITAGNDSELVFKLLNKFGMKILRELDGVYAFAYQTKEHVYLARDLIGVKPLWYVEDFAFASERKALIEMGYNQDKIQELNPRRILKYNKETGKIKFMKRQFFRVKPEHKDKYDVLKKRVAGLIVNSVAKRIPDRKFGLLFSGGIDSVMIALICKELGVDFTCYTVAIDEPGLKTSEDLDYAQRIARELGLELRVRKVKLREIENYLKKVVPLIEDNNVVKVGVGLTFYIACETAKKDGIKVIFSGLGSEEIFAGYERHKDSTDINRECLSGLLKMYERDLYRDDVVTMNNNLELRLPFLDKFLVNYSLKIPAKYKIKQINKFILRDIALSFGLRKDFAMRKKRAAQYGSKIDKALAKLAKKQGKSKSEYLKQFYNPKNLKLGVLLTSGKDSHYAMHIMHKQNYEIGCLITIKSINPDSYMFHTPNIDIVKLQSEALDIPLVMETTHGRKEEELKALEKAIKKAFRSYGIHGIVTGALFSTYQRERIEKIADRLGLKIFSPLWHMNQEYEMRQLTKEFEFMFSSVAAYGLDKAWIGRKITDKDVDRLVELNKKYGINIAGEGGEFESLVIDMPMYNKKIKILKSKIIEDSNECARSVIEKAKLIKK